MASHLIVLLAAALCCTLSAPCSAQWKGDGTQRWEASVPYEPLVSLPEYHTDMPLDCMVAYIVLDSVARTLEDGAYIRNFPQKTSLDTLKVLARFFYALYDYDPMLIKRYISHSYEKINDSLHTFKTYPVHLHTGFVQSVLGVRTLGAAFTMLLQSHFIVKAKVIDVRKGMDTSYNQREWVNVACQVLDTIKGSRLPNMCNSEHSTPGSGRKTQDVAPWESRHCIVYGHSQRLATGGLNNSPGAMQGEIVIPEIGDQVYLFLLVGHEFDYLSISPLNEYDVNGGIFVIEEGEVLDTGNFWGLGVTPEEADFRALLDQKIAEIKSWWIQP